MSTVRFAKTLLSLLLSPTFAGAVGTPAGITQDPQQAPTDQQQSAKPDNTEKNLPTNHRDANRADQQGQSASDTTMTKKIRQSVSADKSMSTYAHNIKIITRDGQVTLKGPVRSNDEKQAIEAKAVEIAGQNKVTNELDIKSNQD